VIYFNDTLKSQSTGRCNRERERLTTSDISQVPRSSSIPRGSICREQGGNIRRFFDISLTLTLTLPLTLEWSPFFGAVPPGARLQVGDGSRTISFVKCPRCESGVLVVFELGDILLDRCEECGGIWFDHGELQAVVGAGGAARLEPMTEPEDASGLCPRCLVEMQPVTASQDPGRPVLVDRCPSCMGLWLERSRLSRIEDSRLLLTVRWLFLGTGPDQAVVDGLPAEQREVVDGALELLRDHPQRTALLGYLERSSGGPEGAG
jgi:Zn-finger nucleic acid-binding protein